MKPLDIHQIKVFEATSAPVIENMPASLLQGLNEKGVVLMRGFDPDLQQFEALTRGICDKFHNAGTRYNGRESKGDNFSTRAFEKNCTLLSHSEGVYAPQEGGRPDIAFFMCSVPPSEKGGETTVVDGATFLDHMPQAWREHFATGIIYKKFWQKARWQGEFMVETIPELVAYLNRFPGVKYQIKDDFLRLFYLTRGITRSRSGHDVFAPGMLTHLPHLTHPRYQNKNVVTNSYNGIYFGDGKAVSDEIVNGLIDIQDAILYPHVWQKGDILILDNTRYMHGRTMTERDCQRILITRFGWLKH